MRQKRAVGRLGQAAEKASNWLWMKRDEKSWSLCLINTMDLLP